MSATAMPQIEEKIGGGRKCPGKAGLLYQLEGLRLSLPLPLWALGWDLVEREGQDPITIFHLPLPDWRNLRSNRGQWTLTQLLGHQIA